MTMSNEYRIDDARTPLQRSAPLALVDLAWDRPQRNGVYVNYPTYKPQEELWEFVDAVYNSLEDGGWALFDADPGIVEGQR